MRINGGNSDSKNRLLFGEDYDGLLNDPENVIKEVNYSEQNQ
jgi:hypothetical protein